MVYAPLVMAALIIQVSTTPINPVIGPAGQLSAHEKQAAMQPLVRAATECIAQSVAADSRYKKVHTTLGELIVDSVPSCVVSVRAMIEGYDNYYGDGAGEAFFVGPYLDVLPTAVGEWIKNYSTR